MKSYIYLIVMLTMYTSCTGQNLDNVAKSFLEETEGYENGEIFYATLSLTDTKELVRFGILGAHQLPYLGIRIKKNGEYKIIENYAIEALLKNIEIVMRDLPEERKIYVLRKIIDVSESHLKMDGWDIIEE